MALSHIVVITLISLLCTALALGGERRPNFVLCMADDQGFADIGYTSDGPLQTPVLDDMARTGLRLDRFYAAAPVCSPTRGSFLTGRHPNRFGCFQWGHTLRPQEITLADALQQAGYRTGHFGKWHLGSTRPESPVSPGNSGFDTWVSSPNFMDNDPLLADHGQVKQYRGESSMVIVEEALKFIHDAAGKDQPFAAVVWFGSPHTPLIGAPELLALYKDADISEEQKHYFAEITGIDRAMGRLREELRSLGIADDTLVLYTSDNGPQGTHERPGSAAPFSGRKAELLEGGVRVPAIIEWPAKIKTGRTTDVPVNSSDIYPTVLELAGVTAENQVQPLDGISVRPLILGERFQRTTPMGFWHYDAPGVRTVSNELLEEQAAGKSPLLYDDVALSQITRQYDVDDRRGDAAWIDGDWKLLIRKRRVETPTMELFNLADDPAEKNNLAAQHPQRAGQMHAALDAWQTSVIRSLNGEDYR